VLAQRTVPLPDDFQKGMTYADGRWCPQVRFDSPSSDISLQNLHASGANWVAIIVTDFTLNVNTTDIFPVPAGTATDAELMHVVGLAHQLGLKVMIKLHIDNIERFGGMWRGDIGSYFSDTEWTIWFKNYKQFIGHYATLSQQLSVEQIAIGTELVHTDSQDKHWRDTVAYVRTLYSGKLTYACNWAGVEPGSPCGVTWWDVLDFIGIDAYYPLAPEGSQPNYEDLKKGWSTHLIQLQTLSQKYNKSIIFTELGYSSQQGTFSHPWSFQITTPLNYAIQADCYRAFFEAVALPNPWLVGVFWWAWWTDPLAGTDWVHLYTPQNKPVLKVLEEFYGGKEVVVKGLEGPFWCGVTNGE